MSEFQYDLFVIGAGSGGVRAARISANYGAKVAIAEEKYLGGTCVNVGCVPKKLLVYASHFSEDFEVAKSFGWSVNGTAFNWNRLILNKNIEIKRLNKVYQKILDNAGVKIINGRASIVNEHAVEINGEIITAKFILIATGSWPSIPDFPGHEYVITSNEAFFLDELPPNIVIVGGGYIAVEFAGIFNGLGVNTTLIYRGPLFLRGFDHDLREKLAQEMRKKGIKLLFNTEIDSIKKSNRSFTASLNNKERLNADLFMYATGRNPNTKNLGLENIKIELNDKGAVRVDTNYCSSLPSIYAIGDVTDRVYLTPVALAEGMALANILFNPLESYVDYKNIPTCVFSQPNIGTVGLTEEEARDILNEITIFNSSFKPMKLSFQDSEEKVFMKIIVDNVTDKVVGVHMLGPDAGEIIQGIAIAIKAGATKKQFDSTIGIHPTAAEEFVTMRTPVSE